MISLYSDTLLHCVPKVDYLKDKFSIGFSPRYYLEYGDIEDDLIDYFRMAGIYIAMVCFCDIPLRHSKQHREMYGKYGIGLKKSWGIQKGLGPIHYVSRDSLFLKQYNREITEAKEKIDAVRNYLLEEIRERRQTDPRSVQGQVDAIQDLSDYIQKNQLLFAYFKPYSGTYSINGITYTNYNYSDEREWRFIPSDDYTGGAANGETFHYIMSGHIPKDNIGVYSDGLRHMPKMHLKFSADDVEHIIVDTNDDVDIIVDHLKTVIDSDSQLLKYTEVEVNSLRTKFLTSADIDRL